MIIRDATSQDAYAITELGVASRRKAYKELLPEEIFDKELVTQERIDKWVKRADESEGLFILAEENEKILGFLWGRHNTNENIPLPYELCAIYVDVDFQRQGVGIELMDEFRRRVNGEGFFLYILKGNKSAKFYEMMGGVERSEYALTKDYYGWDAPFSVFTFE